MSGIPVRRWAMPALASAAIGLAALLAWRWHAAAEQQALASDTGGVTGAATQAGAGPVASVPEGPFDAMRPQLEAAAHAGDADAAFRLGRTLAHCIDYTPVPGGRMTAMIAEMVAGAGNAIRIDGRPIGDDRNIDLLLFAHAEATRLCADTDGLRADPPADGALYYVTLAAERGHPEAMALYPDVAFREFKSLSALVDAADEVERRRNRATQMLSVAVRSGEPAALLAMSRAHDADGWLTPDPARALGFWLAFSETPMHRRFPDSLTSEHVRKLEQTASAEERAHARALARELQQPAVDPSEAPRQ
ncbi:hypothetical protein [Luteimonas deserti]|uniref:Uncharacterized protein n=1 Tax=Luteimonas deserti TaxID=2752306 RepID=A0A7Z0QRB5_9GAMM|nr:hypothetical protein [Luteimonas deserti]NYZ63283.1 hypothetical protein [Luteimonas deserti]